MNIIIKTKDLELTKATETYVNKKMETLERFIQSFNQENILAEVELSLTVGGQQTGDIFRAEINFSLDGKLLRATSTQNNLYAAIDEVRDDLEREIKKFKEKRETIIIRGARSIKKMLNISPLARFRKKE